MAHTLRELESLIPANPLNDELRIELEQLLATTEPNDIEHELLQRERQIADALDRGHPVAEIIHEYKQFRIAQSDYFWDMRGCVDHLFRPFSLWLVHCEQNRTFALDVALRNKLNIEPDLQSLPIEIVRGKQLDSAFETKNGIIDFLRRYRGPSGNEPDLNDDEIQIAILATYSRVTPQKIA